MLCSGRCALIILLAASLLPGSCSFPEYQFADSEPPGVGGTPPAVGGATTGGVAGSTGGVVSSGGAGGSGGEILSPGCRDGILNGEETDVDCGGSECPGCSMGQQCEDHFDCASEHCHELESVCAPSLVVRCRCTANCTDETVAASRMEFRLTNRGPSSMPLDGVILRYYFTRDHASSVALCTASGLPGECETIVGSERTYDRATATATHLLELSFSGENGQVEPNTTTLPTGIEVRAPAGHTTRQTDDYSFYPSETSEPPTLDCDRLTLHRVTGRPGGALIWGVPPELADE